MSTKMMGGTAVTRLTLAIALMASFPQVCLAAERVDPVDVAAEPVASVAQGVAPVKPDLFAEPAVRAAIADGVTTGIALASGAVEMNPLVVTSPVGLIALTAGKIGLVKYAEGLPESDKRLVKKSSTAFWSGAAANNIMVLLAAPPPFPLLAGVAIAVLGWRHMATVMWSRTGWQP